MMIVHRFKSVALMVALKHVNILRLPPTVLMPKLQVNLSNDWEIKMYLSPSVIHLATLKKYNHIAVCHGVLRLMEKRFPEHELLEVYPIVLNLALVPFYLVQSNVYLETK